MAGLWLGHLWLLRAWMTHRGLGSIVGRRALLLGAVLSFFEGLAARESLGSSPYRGQALKAVGASTCHRLERPSIGS